MKGPRAERKRENPEIVKFNYNRNTKSRSMKLHVPQVGKGLRQYKEAQLNNWGRTPKKHESSNKNKVTLYLGKKVPQENHTEERVRGKRREGSQKFHN